MPVMPLSLVLKFLSRFDLTARELGTRARKPFKLEDESDVRDLVYAALKPLIDDLELEPSIESLASLGGRPDLCSKEMGLVIEIKTTLKESRNEKEILRECCDRVTRYSSFPPLQYLVLFVYDPAHVIRDRDNVARDLTGLFAKGEKKFKTYLVGPGFPVPLYVDKEETEAPKTQAKRRATNDEDARARLKAKLAQIATQDRQFQLGYPVALEYETLDDELALQEGMAQRLFVQVLMEKGYVIENQGQDTIAFKNAPMMFTPPRGTGRRW